MSGELPPRPSSASGEPLPPNAPAFDGDERTPLMPERHKPEPPAAGLGPTLAWYQTSVEVNILRFVATFIVVMLLASLIFAEEAGPYYPYYAWIYSWQIWLIVLGASLLVASPLRMTRQSAGADWFACNRYPLLLWWRRHSSRYVNTYEISKIRRVNSLTGQTTLTFEDLRGNRLGAQWKELQRDRRIWDLLYNGILHSLAKGASIEDYAQILLQIPFEATRAKFFNWKAGNMPNWPADMPMPDPAMLPEEDEDSHEIPRDE